MINDIESIIITKNQIDEKVKELGKIIAKDYSGKKLMLIGILKGSVVFISDLMREIDIPLEIDFMAVSSYGMSSKTSGIVKIIKDLDEDIEGKDILIVEDIIDSGITLNHLKEFFKTRNVKSLKICTLLNKPERRKVDIEIDYTGFDIPDKFAVGYGLDYAGKYRNLPFIGVLKKEIYQ